MNTRFSFSALLILVSLLTVSCGPDERSIPLNRVRLSLSDSLSQHIQSLSFARQGDSLLAYLSHPDATYRYLAAMGFGSMQDAIPVDSLARLLKDPVDKVRAAAAFSLGQSGREDAEEPLLEAFEQFDTAGSFRMANQAILEAVGKCGSPASLQALSTISTYGPADTALLEGQALGLYRFALRGMNHEAGTRHMLRIVTQPEYPLPVRVIAANYLYRSRQISIDEAFVSELARTFIGDEDPRIRMSLAIGVAKTGSPLALEALENAYRLDPDYRVKCNVISAMANFDYDEVRDLAFEALRDSNLLVAERAATFFLENGIARDGFLYYSIAREGLPWQVNTPLYAAVLRHLPSQYKDVRNSATSRLRQKLRDDETSPFEKVAALRALAEDPWNFRFIYEQGFPSDIDMVRQGAVEALGLISSDPGASSETFTRYLAPHFREAIESGDPALMLPAAEALGQGDRNYRDVYGDLDFLESAYAEVSSRQPIPELERSLAIALDSLVGGDRSARLGPPLRAIDWKLLEQAGPNPEITLQTEEGAIVLRLFSQEAPGTVSSFLQLIEDGYYEESYFYRVVPNFVAQGAQPLGFRSPSFVLSSELSPRHYLEGGRLGMASAGPHTESIHFFITHSPTPHLDGRYTLFGEVVEGMEVVHRLRRGSRIERTIYTPEALN